jgi:Tfp pilus assembly protein FimV
MVSGKSRSAIAAITLAASGAASALGFGDFRAQVLLGQPLNLALPVSLGEGESLSADCAAAEVTAGESRLPAGTVRVRVTQGRDGSEAIIRVSSTVPIDEPVVNVTVSAGCPPRMTRTLVLLADPPLVSPTLASTTNTSPATNTAAPAAAPEPSRSTAAAPAGSAAPAPAR